MKARPMNLVLDEDNPRAQAGDNAPPDAIGMAKYYTDELSRWMDANPVIQDAEAAKEAKRLADSAKLALKELDDERDAKVRPLNVRVKELREPYNAPEATLKAIIKEIAGRRTVYTKAEEARRQAIADAEHAKAIEAAQAAQEAADREREARENAEAGEFGTSIGDAIARTAELEAEAKRAARAAAIAEKDATVRTSTGIGKAEGMHTRETLCVAEPSAAIGEIGLTVKIAAAIIVEAREFRRLRGRLPKGVTATVERTY